MSMPTCHFEQELWGSCKCLFPLSYIHCCCRPPSFRRMPACFCPFLGWLCLHALFSFTSSAPFLFFFWSNVLSGPKLPCLISFSPYEVIPSIYYGLYLEHLHPSHSPWYTCCQSPSPIHTWSSSKLYLKQYFSMKPLSPVSRVLYHTWIHWLQIKLVKDKLLHLSKLIFSAAF